MILSLQSYFKIFPVPSKHLKVSLTIFRGLNCSKFAYNALYANFDYLQILVLSSDDIILPGYNRLASHRANICLVSDIHLVKREFSIGVGISYRRLLTHTIDRIIDGISEDIVYPVNIRVSDGLDGSGCHKIYQQATPHPEITTKNFLLFGFKVITITSASGNIIWKNTSPNSPFLIRPITILALTEKEEDVKYLMDIKINEETALIEKNGLQLISGHCEVKIIRSLFDTKMAEILSGAGGAVCQLCTATFKQIYDSDIVNNGFQMNRTVTNARMIFEDVVEEEFLSLSSNQRFNITHKPISELDIVSGSRLHAYLRCFSWFLNLICHLNAGVTNKWSPSLNSVTSSKKFVTSLIKEKLNITIDAPSIQGGTTTTGNIVRKCLKRENETDKDFLYWVLTTIPIEYKQTLNNIFNYLGAILRVFKSSRRIDIEELEFACEQTYIIILSNFPWVNITPTLHKVLAHSASIISEFNNGYGLEELSEEGLEACNKHIRRYRERLSRKFSFEDNIQDIFVKLIHKAILN